MNTDRIKRWINVISAQVDMLEHTEHYDLTELRLDAEHLVMIVEEMERDNQ